MRIIFLGSDRHSVKEAIKIALQKKIEIVACVIEQYGSEFEQLCMDHKIPIFSINEIYDMISNKRLMEFDFAISYLCPKIIKKEFIDAANGNVINFHPAPVQEHKGVAACVYCLLNDYNYWGVTAHYVVPKIDAGDIIKQRFFDIEKNITAKMLETTAQEEQLKLFDEVMDMIVSGKKLPRIKQEEGAGCYYSRKQLEKDKVISLTDSSEEIDKKIRALWFPPFHGASIVIDGKRYSLVNEEILEHISQS